MAQLISPHKARAWIFGSATSYMPLLDGRENDKQPATAMSYLSIDSEQLGSVSDAFASLATIRSHIRHDTPACLSVLYY
uniref:Uncharacterized protein n=1 Tax=Tanacetum cinerariifolium TaxID=118510 RepID=A0A699X7Z5_TANCI|nr:hypothetical protein [Tanacetum cinerariifolium]